MPKISQDFDLASFCKDPAPALKRLRKTKRQIFLTVKGKQQLVLHHPAEFERIMTLARKADIHEALRQADDAIAAGRTRPAKEVFDEMRKKYKIPR